jgi:hypothetical protein
LCWAVLNFFGDIVKFAFLKVEDEFEVHCSRGSASLRSRASPAFSTFVVMVLVVITWTVDYVVV